MKKGAGLYFQALAIIASILSIIFCCLDLEGPSSLIFSFSVACFIALVATYFVRKKKIRTIIYISVTALAFASVALVFYMRGIEWKDWHWNDSDYVYEYYYHHPYEYDFKRLVFEVCALPIFSLLTMIYNIKFGVDEEIKLMSNNYMQEDCSENKVDGNYVESRFGAIELFDDYFVVSANFLPFRCARRKRLSTIIYYDQLTNAAFRPAGWFRGDILLWHKSVMRPRPDTRIPFRLWLPGTSRKNSKEYEAIYNKIVEKMHANKKQLRDSATKNVLY